MMCGSHLNNVWCCGVVATNPDFLSDPGIEILEMRCVLGGAPLVLGEISLKM